MGNGELQCVLACQLFLFWFLLHRLQIEALFHSRTSRRRRSEYSHMLLAGLRSARDDIPEGKLYRYQFSLTDSFGHTKLDFVNYVGPHAPELRLACRHASLYSISFHG